MPDIFSKEKRSEIMRKIKSSGTQIEMKLKGYLEESKIRFEYQPKIFGKPDFLIKPNIVVFCDSSFWHGKNWKKLQHKLPNKYWYEHIDRNRKRDILVKRKLKEKGYVVLRFWDHDIEKKPYECISKIRTALIRTTVEE
jgi:DNA mismatch endonuclease (patch repair protein)